MNAHVAVVVSAIVGMVKSDSCFFDLAKMAAETGQTKDQTPPDIEALIIKGVTCEGVGKTCCSALHTLEEAAIQSQDSNPYTHPTPPPPSAYVGKCGRREQVKVFDCVKAEYRRVAATKTGQKSGMPPFPIPEPVADTSPDGEGTCSAPPPMTGMEAQGVSSGCCIALNYAGTHPQMKPPDAARVIGKCGVKDQDNLLAFAQQSGILPPQQNLVEQVAMAKSAAIDMMVNMIHSPSEQQSASSSYQIGSIALFGSIGGFAGAIFTLALAKQCSSERVEKKTPLLA
jgi:hypothetical protein